ncbi:MAG: DUF4270 family protein [Saprospiraceae bacterium]
MKKIFSGQLFLLFLSACLALVSSCSKSTDVGGDILDQDQVGLGLIDTLTLRSVSVKNDSVISPSSNNFTLTYPSGNITDPVFGKTSAGFYMQMFTTLAYSTRNTTNAVVDSVVLSLKYDTLSFGNISQPRTLGVYRVLDDISTQDHYSNVVFKTQTNPLNDINQSFISRIKYVKDSVKVIGYTDSAKLVLAPHLRIKLDNTIGKEILSLDSTKLNTNSEFAKIFKGLYIKPLSEDKGLIRFFLTKFDGTIATYNQLTNVNIYYRDNNNVKRIMTLYAYADATTTSTKSVNFVNEPSAALKNAINNQSIGDTIVYLQGMNGADVKITLPNIKQLKGKNLIVDKAELELFVKPTADGFETPPQLAIRKKNFGTVSTDLIEDFNFSLNSSTRLISFGGKPEKVNINGVSLLKYKFNLSYYAQKMIDDSSISDSFFVTFENKSSSIGRVVFYGAKHSKFPMKLRIFYTKL